ncbi:MAG TPA: hypothetical protein VEX86_23645, partial [Longimicrobium sp.]|nr:hypothetical protein [Longimicrobium sp.]
SGGTAAPAGATRTATVRRTLTSGVTASNVAVATVRGPTSRGSSAKTLQMALVVESTDTAESDRIEDAWSAWTITLPGGVP